MKQAYTIAFLAEEFDEAVLRDVLEERYGADACTIARRRPAKAVAEAPVAGRQSVGVARLADGILGALASGQPTPFAALAEKVAEPRPTRLYGALRALVADGRVRRLAYGLYLLGSAPEPEPELLRLHRVARRLSPHPARTDAILAHLARPIAAPELVEHLGVTRQRVDQKLKQLMGDGLVFRRRIHGHPWVYCTDERMLLAWLPSPAAGDIGESLRRTLFCLPLSGLAGASEVGKAAKLERVTLKNHLDRLQELGLLQRIPIGRGGLVGLTAAGLALAVASAGSLRLSPGAGLDDADYLRVGVLQILVTLGPLTYREIRALLGPGLGIHTTFRHENRTAQILIGLRRSGLLDKAPVADALQVIHAATDRAAAILAAVAAVLPPPDRAALETLLLDAKEAPTREAGSSGSGRPGPSYQPQGRTLEIMRILADSFRTMDEVNKRLSTPYGNERSAYLALKALKHRGWARSEATGSHTPSRWTLTQIGRSRLAAELALDGAVDAPAHAEVGHEL